MENERNEHAARKTHAAKKAKLNRRAQNFLTVLALLAVLAAAGFLAFEILRVQTVSVIGNSAVSSYDIVTLSRLELGQSIFDVNFEQVKENVASHPRLAVKEVRFSFPDKITIEVRERESAAMTRQLDNMITLDTEGVVLDVSSAAQDSGLIGVTGLSVSGYTVGEPLALREELQFSVMCNMIDALHNSQQRAWYKSIDLKNPVDVRLVTFDDITVRIGVDEDIHDKLNRAGNVLIELQVRGLTGGILDVTQTGTAIYTPPDSLLAREGAVIATPTDVSTGTDLASGTDIPGGTDGAGGADGDGAVPGDGDGGGATYD